MEKKDHTGRSRFNITRKNIVLTAGVIAVLLVAGGGVWFWYASTQEETQTQAELRAEMARSAFGGTVTAAAENEITVENTRFEETRTFTVTEETDITRGIEQQRLQPSGLQAGMTVNVMYYPDTKEAASMWVATEE